MTARICFNEPLIVPLRFLRILIIHAEFSEKKQHPIATQLEKLWLQDLPIIPVVIGARWSTYSTKYFHGFPTKPNFYADPIFTTNPDNILLFTRIAPGGRAGT